MGREREQGAKKRTLSECRGPPSIFVAIVDAEVMNQVPTYLAAGRALHKVIS